MISQVKQLLRKSVGYSLYNDLKYLFYKNLTDDMGYSKDYYKVLEDSYNYCYFLLAETLMIEFHPKSLVDVGCGSGGISLAFMKAGCKEISAFDYSKAAVELSRSKGIVSAQEIDLTKAEIIPAKGDLCICLEVAEHLPESYAKNLCRLLSEVAPILVFTAAPPDQGGHLHLNEKPQSYWIDLMKSFVMEYDVEAVDRIRKAFNGRMISDYDTNLMVFKKVLAT